MLAMLALPGVGMYLWLAATSLATEGHVVGPVGTLLILTVAMSPALAVSACLLFAARALWLGRPFAWMPAATGHAGAALLAAAFLLLMGAQVLPSDSRLAGLGALLAVVTAAALLHPSVGGWSRRSLGAERAPGPVVRRAQAPQAVRIAVGLLTATAALALVVPVGLMLWHRNGTLVPFLMMPFLLCAAVLWRASVALPRGNSFGQEAGGRASVAAFALSLPLLLPSLWRPMPVLLAVPAIALATAFAMVHPVVRAWAPGAAEAAPPA